jgi:hypothetical protein
MKKAKKKSHLARIQNHDVPNTKYTPSY